MKFQRRTMALATLCLGLGLGTGSVQAQQKLLLNSFIGVNHPITTQVIKPWADEVAKATQGRVVIDVHRRACRHRPSNSMG